MEFGVKYGVLFVVWSGHWSLVHGVRSLIWSSFCSTAEVWSVEYTIVLESGMEFGVQYGVLFVVWSTQ